MNKEELDTYLIQTAYSLFKIVRGLLLITGHKKHPIPTYDDTLDMIDVINMLEEALVKIVSGL